MKKLLISVLCIMLIVFIALLVVIFNLGPIVKIAVNSYGPDITKTEMRLSNADVDVFQAQARLENFVLGNPEGFSSPHAITVGSVLVDVDESSLTKNPVIINRVEVLQPMITYEIKGTTDNFRTMMDNMKKPEKPVSTGEKKAPAKKEGKKVVIRDLVLKDIQIKTAADIAGGNIATTTISELHLKNIGEKQNGVDMAQAVLIVLNELYGQIISPDVLNVFKNQLKGYEKELDGVAKEMKTLGGKLKGLFD